MDDSPGGLRRRPTPSVKRPSIRHHQSNRMMYEKKDPSSGALSPNTSSGHGLGGVRVTKEEADTILQELANQDDDSKKTWSRLVVENYLSKYVWYWPYKDLPNGPSLSKAWAYYEHVTLPRHFVGDGSLDTVLRRAEPGEHEEETELYDWKRLTQANMIEWGTGLDLYFISLRFFAALMLFCGIINIPAIMYYGSTEYNGDALTNYNWPLQGSAVCNDTAFVVCTDCSADDWQRDPTRFATSGDVALVRRNMCLKDNDLSIIGFTSLATILFVILALGVFSFYLHAREVRFDEDRVTTTDYSVIVENPPPDAIDPDKWKEFFSQFATDGDQVTFVTVALNNNVLVRKLVTRRIFLNQLRMKLPDGTDLDDESAVKSAIAQYNEEKANQESNFIGMILDRIVVPLSNLINMLLPPEKLVVQIKALTSEIKELQEREYTASQVFVTFETEDGQRTALDALKVGQIDLHLNRTSAVAPECVFEGRVLNVHEPTAPDSVRWRDLSYGPAEKLVRRGLILAANVGMLGVAGTCIKLVRDRSGPSIAALVTTLFNSTIPQILKILMIFEPHATEGSYQSSLYLNITIFRWTLSAGLAQIITPVTATLGYEKTDLLPTTLAILQYDIWLGPLLRLSDYFSNFKKHVLAPRVKTQEEMNLSFQGTVSNIGERYTDFTKTLFVVFFYSALFPPGFFFGFLILFFQYYVDRFSLVRLWSWQPAIGSELAIFSRRFFFTSAALCACVMSAYAFAQFPYDNLCPDLDSEKNCSGTYFDVKNLDGDYLGIIEVEQPECMVFCEQSWHGYDGVAFPPTSDIQDAGKVWMTSKQENISDGFGWLSVAILIAFMLALFGRTTYLSVKSIFTGREKPDGSTQHIDFSSNPDIFAYVPQIKLVGQPFPYLVCDIDDIDQGLVGWNDPAHSYDFYNLIFDIPHKSLRRTAIIENNTRGTTTIAQQEEYHQDEFVENPYVRYVVNTPVPTGRPIYSVVKHYPTKWQIKLAAQGEAYSAQ